MSTTRSTAPETSTRRRKGFAGVLAAVAAVAVIAVGVISLTSGGDRQPAASDGRQAPAIAFELFDGSSATLAEYRGEPLVVNFWASWCPSCVAEMSAAFRPAQLSFGDRVVFLGMNLQDERSRAIRLVEETGVLFELAEDPRGDLYSALGGLGMPFTVFIAPDGTIVHAHNGSVTEQQLEDLIAEHLLS